MQAEIEVALRNKKMTAAQAKQVLASNLEEIARLRSLSDNLLNLTRLGSNGLNQKTINLSKVIAGSIRQSEQQYGLKIAADIQKDITAKGDADLLGQLASILTDNAVKYAGNKPPDIHMQVYKRDKNAVLKITDKGIGIKPTELPYIFDRFYRGTNATGHSVSGHGLGLGLAKQIVEAHHGKIAAVSKNGQTTFTVSLPGV